MKVRELIAELIECDMNEEVFIGLGPNGEPSGHSKVHSVTDYGNSLPKGCGVRCPFGVYIIPLEHLVISDD